MNKVMTEWTDLFFKSHYILSSLLLLQDFAKDRYGISPMVQSQQKLGQCPPQLLSVDLGGHLAPTGWNIDRVPGAGSAVGRCLSWRDNLMLSGSPGVPFSAPWCPSLAVTHESLYEINLGWGVGSARLPGLKQNKSSPTRDRWSFHVGWYWTSQTPRAL